MNFGGLMMKKRNNKQTNEWISYKQFMLEFDSKEIKTRMHNHKTHTDIMECDISELEKKALDFLIYNTELYNLDNDDEDKFEFSYDEDLLCLYYAIHRFMETGSREDAFDVYYCYIDIFIENHEKARKLIEMLSDYENNGSNLVGKHRDHYSHSVNVFITGLAIFNTNINFRTSFYETYFDYASLSDEEKKMMHNDQNKAYEFLRLWGTTALFHDVGYPFEIPFEQIKTYFNPKMDEDYNEQIPFIAYNQMENLFDLNKFLKGLIKDKKEVEIEKKCTEYVMKLLEKDEKHIPKYPSIADVISHHIVRKLERCRFISCAVDVEEYIKGILISKPTSPEMHKYYMDHALFSSILLFLIPPQIRLSLFRR